MPEHWPLDEDLKCVVCGCELPRGDYRHPGICRDCYWEKFEDERKDDGK